MAEMDSKSRIDYNVHMNFKAHVEQGEKFSLRLGGFETGQDLNLRPSGLEPDELPTAPPCCE